MKKISRIKAIRLFGLAIILIFTVYIYTFNIPFPGDSIYDSKDPVITMSDIDYGVIHYTFATISTLLFIVMIIIYVIEIYQYNVDYDGGYKSILRWFSYSEHDTPSDEINPNIGDKIIEYNKFNKKKFIFWSIAIILFFIIWSFGKSIYKDMKFMYNKSVLYHNDYNQKVQEKSGFYDKMWKTYLQKDKITNINRETFIMVTQIIMENRADGENLTWKWVQENQNIPYSEFSKFYADLSDFITSQREDYFKIEKDCQLIANSNNILLDTFPNNIYNSILNRQKINFEYGILSDSTLNVINSKKENLE